MIMGASNDPENMIARTEAPGAAVSSDHDVIASAPGRHAGNASPDSGLVRVPTHRAAARRTPVPGTSVRRDDPDAAEDQAVAFELYPPVPVTVVIAARGTVEG
jgi:hypothetical protein